MCHGKGRKANKGHNFWAIVRTYYSKRSSSTLWIHGMPRSINLLNLLTVFAHIAGPLSRNNPGATTEGATARMIGHHLKHCQTPPKIINGLNLLRASKSPAEHVGRLDMARLAYNKKYSLHRFSWTGDTVTIKQVPMRPTKIIHLTRILQTSNANRDVEPVPAGNLLASCVLFNNVLQTLRKPL